MVSRSSFKRTSVLVLGAVAASTPVAAAHGPCDIYQSGGTPCVAAHSTTRSLYLKYTGPLYQVTRADGQTLNISTVQVNDDGDRVGIANAAAQDSFCSGTTCLITTIYDQSGNGNHLGQARGYWPGPGPDGVDNYASATGAPIMLDGQKVYGVFIPPGTGYRRNHTIGIATGDEPEGIYEVIDGTHYNQWCCFDYGNSEVSATDTGSGHMEAVYFGDSTQWGSGEGSGPWIMADLENGLFSGYSPKTNADASISHRFVTAIVKGEPGHWAIKGADATSGSLTYYYNGSYPAGYSPMHKEGAIVLGTGGDNSISGQGTWYEGAMTSGYPSDDVEAMVQANIVQAKYATTSMTSGRALTVGSSVSLVASAGKSASRAGKWRRSFFGGESVRYLAHTGSMMHTAEVSPSSEKALQEQASWTVRAGLGHSACFSFEAVDAPGRFVRSDRDNLVLELRDGSKQFDEDATFCPQAALNGLPHAHTLPSWNRPTRHIRHHDGGAHAARNGGHRDCDTTDSFSDDASWIVIPGFA